MSKEKDQIIKSYNDNVEAFKIKFDRIGPMTKHIKRAFSYFEDNKKLKVIELGCGYGRDGKEILKRTDDYLGIDLSEEMIKLARKEISKNHFQVADLETFDLPKNLDIVFAFASLLHSGKTPLKNVFKKAYQALNNGGIFYICTKYGRHKRVLVENEFGKRTFYFYTIKDIEKIAPMFKIIHKEIQTIRNQKWLTIVLRKV